MLFNFEAERVFTIKDIQAYTKDHNVKMLSEYSADFWAGYKANYQYFDRLFMKRYSSWFPFDQEYSEGVASIQQDFTYDVYAHLMANDKRYSELWRINVIPDNDAYSLTNNVDYTESYEEDNSKDITYNKGEQTDTEDLEHTKGSQTDTEDLSTTYGAQSEDTVNSTSAYNSASFQEVDKTEVDRGTYDDTEDNERTYGQRIDSDDNSRTYGAREDTTGETGSKDYTLHKVGNMGVQTVDDMLLKHWNNWTMFDFYGMVFDEIARDLLRGC